MTGVAGGERAVLVYPDGDAVARTTAARLLLAIGDAQALRPSVHVCLTGGTVGTKVLTEVAASSLRDLIDWTTVHLWWGDERFVPRDSADRNEGQARAAMIDALPLPDANLHPFPATEDAADVDAAATAFVGVLAEHPDGSGRAGWPTMDVTLLGVGPDGHVASLFPGHDTLDATDAGVVAEHDSPKPPALRLSLTLPVLNDSRQVWFVVAGQDKADAVATALAGGDLPAAKVAGRDVTLWLLDAAAANG